MQAISAHDAVKGWLARYSAAALLGVAIVGLLVGGIVRWQGATASADAAWLAVSACGLLYAVWAMVDALLRKRVGVDLLAVLALSGAVAVGELLAAAVITVMLASGHALEAWAAGRARRDLSSLLERAPRSGRKYCGDSLQTVPLTEIAPGDVLL